MRPTCRRSLLLPQYYAPGLRATPLPAIRQTGLGQFAGRRRALFQPPENIWHPAVMRARPAVEPAQPLAPSRLVARSRALATSASGAGFVRRLLPFVANRH